MTEKSILEQKSSSIEILYKEQEMSHDLKVGDFNFRLKLYKSLSEKKEVILINNSDTIGEAVNKIILNI